MSENAVVAFFENSDPIKSSYAVKAGLAQLLRGGVVVEVSSPEQGQIAEAAGAVAITVVHNAANVNAGGVARMSDPDLIREIKKAVTVPVVGKARIGHFVEAQVLEAVGVDFIDESEVLTRADDVNYINKHNFGVPFICGCRDLGEALCRIAEGATVVRTEVEAEGEKMVETVRQARSVLGEVRRLQTLDKDELFDYAKQIRAPYELVKLTKRLGRLPVVGFAAGGISTPVDAALMMQLGCDGVFVSSGLPARRVAAIVKAVTHYNDSQILAEASTEYGEDV